jgi:uncharacterized RDD family membrane protein YckC
VSAQGWRLRLFVARMSAYAVDVVITGAIVLVSQLAIWKAGLNPVAPDPTAVKLHLWVALTVNVPVLAYFVITTRLYGATLGKSVLKLQTLPAEGEGRVPTPRLLVRYLVVLAPFEVNHTAMFHEWVWAFAAVYVLAGIILVSMFLHPEGRGVHDRIAGTRVARRHGPQPSLFGGDAGG